MSQGFIMAHVLFKLLTIPEGSTILGQRYSYFLTKTDVKHNHWLSKNKCLIYDIYYQIPNTELVTVDALAKCINLLI